MLGPKYYKVNGISALKPYQLGPWTLTVPETVRAVGFVRFRVYGFRVYGSGL